MQKFSIDKAWFHRRLKERGYSLRGFADAMQMDPAAVSRMLSGQRNMSAEEQDKIASLLDLALTDIAQHRGDRGKGFEERGQAGYEGDGSGGGTRNVEHSNYRRRPARHPIFGCMKSTMIVADDLDLTAPAEPGWAKVYDDE